MSKEINCKRLRLILSLAVWSPSKPGREYSVVDVYLRNRIIKKLQQLDRQIKEKPPIKEGF